MCYTVIQGPLRSWTIFVIDFSSLLSSVVFRVNKIIIVGDFKIHTDDPSYSPKNS